MSITVEAERCWLMILVEIERTRAAMLALAAS